MAVAVQDIVHAFLQTYYQRMKKDPSKVSCLYSTTAELTHINYQVDFDCEQDVLSTIKLTGKDNISRFFTRNNKKVSDLKAKIDTCDFQTVGASHSSILILTTGELFWTGTPAYRFCQSIVLQPNADNKDAFDVTNDVIRFIPDNLSPYVKTSEPELKKNGKQSEQTSVNEGSKVGEAKVDSNEVKKPESEHKATNVETSGLTESSKLQESSPEKPSSKPSEMEPRPVSGGKDDESEKEFKKTPINVEAQASRSGSSTKAETVGQAAAPEGKTSSAETEVAAKPAVPPVRMSWASKLAASNDTFKAPAPVANSEVSKTEHTPPPTSKKVHETKHEFQNVQKESTNNRITKKKPQFSTVNKDGYYPIYIKGTAGIKEEQLKSVLEHEFGTIMKMTTADNFAVVDFETQKSQVDALERKQLTIGDTEVYLSRKTVKKSSSTPPAGSSSGIRSHKKHSNKKRD